MNLLRPLLMLAALAAMGPPNCGAVFAQETPNVVARINFTGRVLWRADGSAQDKLLDPVRDRGRALHAGEAVKCDPGGRLTLVLDDHEVIKRDDRQGWYTLPRPAAADRDAKSDLDHWGSAGGITRGAGQSWGISSPANGGNARVEHLVIRWWEEKDLGQLRITVTDLKTDAQICCQPDLVVESSPGFLNSQQLRAALRNFRKDHDTRTLRLSIESTKFPPQESLFGLLSEEQEAGVQKELATWDQLADSLIRHIARAGVLQRNGLLAEAGEEYDAALQEAPDSAELLADAIALNRRIGNDARVRELESRQAAAK